MVTASHNPKQYNGYKVYDQNGVQIIPPVDTDIAREIQDNEALWDDVEKAFNRSSGLCHENASEEGGRLEDPRERMAAAYLCEMSRDLCSRRVETEESDLKVVYTAMHGVGFPFVKQLLEQFGFSRGLVPVVEQCDPDPEFPTVPFPNPEEAGALDMAIKAADANSAPLVIANDPDADRLACAEKFNGRWRQFTGDEVGTILASYLGQIRAERGLPKEKMLFVCSVVSSKMLKAFAEAEGSVFAETPTGFKWLGNKAAELEGSRGLLPVLVYEEALGYAVTPLIRDKDGVSAAAVLVELACCLHTKGSSLTEYLSELRSRLGYFVTNNGYKTATPQQQQKALAWLCNGGEYHKRFGTYSISSVRDVAAGIDTGAPDGLSSFPRSAGDMVTLRFTNGAVITLRPSGTEPKFKWYAELCREDAEAAKAELQKIVQAVVGALPLTCG